MEKMCFQFRVEESGVMDGKSGGDGTGEPR